MKYSNWIGIAAAVTLVIACFLPWTYHPDLDKVFTGFFSQNNVYGKPGYAFIVLAAVAVIFYLIPKVWAKRGNLIVCAIVVAYAVKNFIVFSTCYTGICPDKKTGLWLMAGAAILMLIMAITPDIPVKNDSRK